MIHKRNRPTDTEAIRIRTSSEFVGVVYAFFSKVFAFFCSFLLYFSNIYSFFLLSSGSSDSISYLPHYKYSITWVVSYIYFCWTFRLPQTPFYPPTISAVFNANWERAPTENRIWITKLNFRFRTATFFLYERKLLVDTEFGYCCMQPKHSV